MIYGEPFFMTVLDDKSSSQVGVKEKNGQKNFFNSNKNQLVKSVTRLSPIVMTLRLIPQVESSFVDGGRPMIFHTNTSLRPMVPPWRASLHRLSMAVVKRSVTARVVFRQNLSQNTTLGGHVIVTNHYSTVSNHCFGIRTCQFENQFLNG